MLFQNKKSKPSRRIPLDSELPTFHFLIAAPRSGTTWLKRALNSHPEVFCTENRLFGNYCDILYENDTTESRLRVTLDKYAVSFLKHYECLHKKDDMENIILNEMIHAIRKITQINTTKRIWVDKITPYPYTAEVVASHIQTFFPDSKIILLIRDGRDVATSGVFHWLTKTQKNHIDENESIERIRREFFLQKKNGAALTKFFSKADIELWCRSWIEPIQIFDNLKRRRFVLTISYEDMISDIRSVLLRIFSFLQTDCSQKIVNKCQRKSTFETMTGGRKPGDMVPHAHIRKGITGDWKNYFTRADGEYFHRLAGKYLIQNGYAADSSWYNSLPLKLQLQAP
jgi:hypothetical protein